VHELSIASSLIDALLDIAKKQSSNKVVEVQLKVGKLKMLSLDQLRFSYEILSKGTVLEGSRMKIEETPGLTRCPNCNHTQEFQASDQSYHFAIPKMNCPKCQTPLVLEGGDECLITKVRLVVPSKPLRASSG